MIFAKLFERDGRQVVVMKEWHADDGDQIGLHFRTNVDGHAVHLSLTFAAEADRDRAFDDFDEAKAFRLRDTSPGIDL